jgi:hypothetical protein
MDVDYEDESDDEYDAGAGTMYTLLF